MTRRVAVYGKGGIGKSTVSSNLTAALSDSGVRVMQIGCDPKHDSTRGLIGGREQTTVLDYLKGTKPSERELSGVVTEGYKGCLCVEAGGPEPGVGCAGRGIISAFDLLSDLGASETDTDLVLYDVLGDVVCGGFAVPLRNGYADTVYIVTSGEFMSIYAANNILRGTANYDPDRIGGLIFNSRGDPEEEVRVDRFSEAVGIPVVARIGRSELFMTAEKRGTTVVEAFPESDVATIFKNLAHTVMKGERHTARFLTEHELERLILGRENVRAAPRRDAVPVVNVPKRRQTPYASRTVNYGDPLGGCAFSGASNTCTSIEGLTTVLHAPRSCTHFTMQLDGMSAIGASKHNRKVVPNYLHPDVVCTDMRESDMVFGGADLLRRTIESKVSEGARDIAVITSCPPGIIGDDAARICRDVESEHPGVSVALMAEDGNATGDWMQGVIDACVALVRRFSIKGEKKPLTVNLIGSKTMSSTVVDDLNIVTDLLSQMGVSVNCVLPGVTDMESIRHVTDASVNLRINGDLFSEKICLFLRDEYGMEYLETPVRGGVSGTRQWLEAVGAYFNRMEEAAEVVSTVEERFRDMLAGARDLLHDKTAAIMSLSGDVDWILESLDAAGIRLLKGYVYYRPDYSPNLDSEIFAKGFVKFTSDEGRKVMDEVSEMHPDILLTMATADVDPSIYQARTPCAPDTDPYAGKALIDSLARGMLAPAREGWREDVA